MSIPEFVKQARADFQRSSYGEVVRVCRLGLVTQPHHIEGRLLLGEALLALQRYDEVLVEMRVLLEADPQNARAMAQKGKALLAKGEPSQAVEWIQRAQIFAPKWTELASLLERAEQQAVEHGDIVVTDPENFDELPTQITETPHPTPPHTSRPRTERLEGENHKLPEKGRMIPGGREISRIILMPQEDLQQNTGSGRYSTPAVEEKSRMRSASREEQRKRRGRKSTRQSRPSQILLFFYIVIGVAIGVGAVYAGLYIRSARFRQTGRARAQVCKWSCRPGDLQGASKSARNLSIHL